MKFTLEITLGNDAMQTYPNLTTAVEQVLGNIIRGHIQNDGDPTAGDSGLVRDLNGNAVGKWEVTE